MKGSGGQASAVCRHAGSTFRKALGQVADFWRESPDCQPGGGKRDELGDIRDGEAQAVFPAPPATAPVRQKQGCRWEDR